jgi:DNA-binding transcriptional MerR regulator
MQRDEFLPLRVIRQELASGGDRKNRDTSSRHVTSVEPKGGAHLDLEQLVEQTGVSPEVISDLVEWRIVQPRQVDGRRLYDDTDREIIKACAELARYGIAGRNLRALRTSADREANLLEQVIAPGLRSSNQRRRQEAIDNLDSLAAVCNNLTHLLLVRDLRKLTGEE